MMCHENQEKAEKSVRTHILRADYVPFFRIGNIENCEATSSTLVSTPMLCAYQILNESTVVLVSKLRLIRGTSPHDLLIIFVCSRQ